MSNSLMLFCVTRICLRTMRSRRSIGTQFSAERCGTRAADSAARWPWQPTTTFHDDHHRYFHCNFGQHVLWFDWLFGTLRTVKRSYGEEAFGGRGVVKME